MDTNTHRIKKFCMYVTPADHSPRHLRNPGYLTWGGNDGVSIGTIVQPDRARALQYDSIADVEAAIDRMGWLKSTSVRPGWTTAYAAEWY